MHSLIDVVMTRAADQNGGLCNAIMLHVTYAGIFDATVDISCQQSVNIYHIIKNVFDITALPTLSNILINCCGLKQPK